MELFKLFATIAIRNNEANNAIDDTTNKAEKSKSKITSAFAKIGKSVVEGLKSEHPKKFSQSLDELTSTVSKQNDKLQTLKNKYKDLYLTYGENSKEAKECAKEIKSLSAELKENETKLSKADKAADKFDQSLDDAAASAEKTEGRMSSAFKKIGAAVISYFAVDKIKDFGLECINAASDLEATSAQFSQVFGNLENTASTNLTKIADSTGVVENRMKGSYTKIAAFAKTTGMETADALGLADRAMVAIADSAAFYDRTLEETTESLQSFLKGNYENDAALGLSCTETTRNAAANQLYGKSFKDLSEQQKQLTLLQMVEDANKLSGAMGQSARETDTWTNQTGNLKQAWQDLKANLGTTVLSTVVDVVKSISEKVQSASEKFEEWKPKIEETVNKLKDVSNWISEHQGLMITLATVIGVITAAVTAYNVVQGVKTAMDNAEATSLWGLVTAKLADAAATMAALAPYLLIAAAIAGLIAIIVLCVKHWDEIKSKVIEVTNKIKDKVTEMKDAVANKFQEMKNKISEKVDTIKTSVSDKFNSIKDKILTPIENAKEKIKNIVDTIKGFFSGMKLSFPDIKLPHFKINPSGWKIGDLLEGSIPKLGIDWYAKAMDDGMILNEPTIFGVNSKGQPMGGGDAGSETVVGTQSLMNMINNAVGQSNNGLYDVLDKILSVLKNIDNSMYDRIVAALQTMGIEFDERELARLVKKYA